MKNNELQVTYIILFESDWKKNSSYSFENWKW